MNLLFEIKKENVINNYKNGIEKDVALVYALENDCYPFFHEEFNDFKNEFSIKENEQIEFYSFIDQIIEKKQYKTFYDIESKFGGKQSRINIIKMLKYAMLTNRFKDDDFQKNLFEEGQYPIETKTIIKDYTEED